tara:strand:+ start:3414 stop:3686 length:273 start_codon:yes stop_codon:yes gene_type:complete
MENIISQHDDIHKAIDNLINIYSIHVKYENKILFLRNKIKSKNHVNVNNEIKNHIKDHILFLNKINELKILLEKHIEDYDKTQIHPLSKL